jgi:hypothetical protein
MYNFNRITESQKNILFFHNTCNQYLANDLQQYYIL